jgi:hypothetical protein
VEVDPKAKFRRGGLRSIAPLQTQRAVQVAARLLPYSSIIDRQTCALRYDIAHERCSSAIQGRGLRIECLFPTTRR